LIYRQLPKEIKPGNPVDSGQIHISTPDGQTCVGHSFTATGFVSPNGTAVSAKLRTTAGQFLCHATHCTTNGDRWRCDFRVASDLLSGTKVVLVVTAPPESVEACVII
jgi:hypothetical protein